jgi:hypothetical protein
MVEITERDFSKLRKAIDKAFDGLEEYAETLEDTWVCREHLENIYTILTKYAKEK